MCYIITHTLEFNSWRGFDAMVEFAKKYYSDLIPMIRIKVPVSADWHGWNNIDNLVNHVNIVRPEDPDEMSIYGKIVFITSKDYTTSPDERAARKVPV